MRSEPDWCQAIAETFMLPENMNMWPLPVGGYLLSVSLRAVDDLPAGTELNYRAEYEVTDVNGVALHERIRWHYALSAAGCAFSEPLPNMNSACPYMLRRVHPDKTPALTATVVHLLLRDVL